MKETAEHIACGGCLGPDEGVFHSSRTCKARNCCRAKGFANCGECRVGSCPMLEKAQSVWDGVPKIAETLSPADLEGPTWATAAVSPRPAPPGLEGRLYVSAGSTPYRFFRLASGRARFSLTRNFTILAIRP